MRIFIENSPGYGHQSAALSVVIKLSQLGFFGEYEVIYPEEIQAKVFQLFAERQSIKNQIHFLTETEYLRLHQLNKIDQVELSISAADDRLVHKILDKSHSRYFLQLQPQGWGESHLYLNNKTIHLKGLFNESLANIQPLNDEQLQKQLTIQPDIHPMVKSLLFNLQHTQGQYEMFPIYGIGRIRYAAMKVRTYLKSIDHRMKIEKNKKPIIIPVLSSFQPVEIDEFRRQFGQKLGFESIIPSEKKLDMKVEIIVVNQVSTLPEFQDGKIYLLFVGFVPQFVFQYLIANASLPVWVAGKNAMNQALLYGKSYLNTVDDYYLPGLNSQSGQLRKLIQKATFAFSEGIRQPFHTPYHTYLSQLIKESRQPNSELNQYLSSISHQLNQKDKLTSGLLTLEQVIQGQICEKVFF